MGCNRRWIERSILRENVSAHLNWLDSYNINTIMIELCKSLPLSRCQKLAKIFTGPMSTSLLCLTTISDVYRSLIPSEIIFTKYLLTQWISKLLGSFEIHWVRQYLVNFTGLVGIVVATVYKTEPIFTVFLHGKLSLCLKIYIYIYDMYIYIYTYRLATFW